MSRKMREKILADVEGYNRQVRQAKAYRRTFAIQAAFFPIVIAYICSEAFREWLIIFNRDFTLMLMFAAFLVGTRGFFRTFISPEGITSSGDGSTYIERLKVHRNSMLAGMSMQEGAELLRDTAVLDMPNEFGDDSPTGRARQHLNSQLGGMGLNEGLKFLRGNRK